METLPAYHCHRIRFLSFESFFWFHVFNSTCPASWLSPRQFGSGSSVLSSSAKVRISRIISRVRSVWGTEEKTRTFILLRLSLFIYFMLLAYSWRTLFLSYCIAQRNEYLLIKFHRSSRNKFHLSSSVRYIILSNITDISFTDIITIVHLSRISCY